MAKVYIHKPERVEAIQFFPDEDCNCKQLDEFIGREAFDNGEECYEETEYYYTDPVSGDDDYVRPRGWIVRKQDGSLHSFTEEQFEELYREEKWLR